MNNFAVDDNPYVDDTRNWQPNIVIGQIDLSSSDVFIEILVRNPKQTHFFFICILERRFGQYEAE